MENAKQLRTELSELFNNLKNGDVDHNIAKELNNTAGKMINSAKVQLDYKVQTKGKDFKIGFLDCE